MEWTEKQPILIESTKSGSSTPQGVRPGIIRPDRADLLTLPLGEAEQACKECYRRKAKCDRKIPICSLCIKYNRHCLYEKHKKSPLTRKHLTEVEEKLERAEMLLRQASLRERAWAATSTHDLHRRRSDPLELHTSLSAVDLQDSVLVPETGFDFNKYNNSADLHKDFPCFRSPLGCGPTYGVTGTGSIVQNLGLEDHEGASYDPSPYLPLDDSNHPSNSLDGPPKLVDDFEWDERFVVAEDELLCNHSSSTYPHGCDEEHEKESSIIDGMASLTVNEREGGYLGMTSGAALLRILHPASSMHIPRIDVKRKGFPFGAHTLAVGHTCIPLYDQPNPNRHVMDSMIDSYFRLSHLSYPLIHEPTFRAQYAEVIGRPNGDCWLILAYMVAAVGVFTTSTKAEALDLPLLAKAKSLLSITYLESGNLTLCQALVLLATLVQKRNQPNSAYNYLGLAVRMAMGLGLHKEFKGWRISPLKMEIRRRVWWTLCVFDVGATITFSRPLAWPGDGIEVALPMNVHDHDLTAGSTSFPPECHEPTVYTSVHYQAAFHLATNTIYARVISHPFPSASTLLSLDASLIAPWEASLPPYFSLTNPEPPLPTRFSLAHAALRWRCSNLRIIMYRPFVIREALKHRDESTVSGSHVQDVSSDARDAYQRCLEEAERTIYSIQEFWERNAHTRMAAWYALYFLFQASLIPVITLRNDPTSPDAPSFRAQITTTLSVIEDLAPVNPSARRCFNVINGLCGQYLGPVTEYAESQHQMNGGFDESGNTPRESDETEQSQGIAAAQEPIDESPQTQMNNVYSMMWPNVPALEADIVMQDDAWMEFLRGESMLEES